MTKTLKILTLAATLAGCTDNPCMWGPASECHIDPGMAAALLGSMNSRPIGQYNTYDYVGVGMIGRANNPVYVCSYYGCP